MSITSKSDLLRQTADQFDTMMDKFNNTKASLEKALDQGGLKREAIEEYLRLFDDGKTLISELLPVRDNVQEIQNTILKPVADVIKDSSGTNKRFGIFGICMALFGIIVTLVGPFLSSYFLKQPSNKDLVASFDTLKSALSPMIQDEAERLQN